MTDRKKARRMTQPETFAIGQLLEKHLIITNEERKKPAEIRTVEFQPDFNDEVIAKMVAPDLNDEHCRNFRQNVFGQIKRQNIDRASVRIAELESEVRILRIRLDNMGTSATLVEEIVKKFNILCDGIGVARGGAVDTRHMKISNPAISDVRAAS
jgi:hypothetical protein